jgi:hypothetical protein
MEVVWDLPTPLFHQDSRLFVYTWLLTELNSKTHAYGLVDMFFSLLGYERGVSDGVAIVVKPAYDLITVVAFDLRIEIVNWFVPVIARITIYLFDERLTW